MQVFDLPIAVLEPESDSGKRFTVTHQTAIECNQILLNSEEKARERIAHIEECARERQHPTAPCKRLSKNTSPAPLLHLFYQPLSTDAPGLHSRHQVCLVAYLTATLYQQTGFCFLKVMLTVPMFAADGSLGKQSVETQMY